MTNTMTNNNHWSSIVLDYYKFTYMNKLKIKQFKLFKHGILIIPLDDNFIFIIIS